ncbi:MAG: 2-aminoethylphosphonate--pyruvate transaminase [Bryobacteraceae bacterium]
MDRKLLFTPGPLTTSDTVKQAMLVDLGSRDRTFLNVVCQIRHKLLQLAGVANADYEAVLMQGSGTMGIESVVSSVIPPDGSLLVLSNGAYGRRIAQIARRLRITTHLVEFPEDQPLPADCLRHAPPATHVAVVHCETSTGVLNPVEEIAAEARRAGVSCFVDAMSSFGGVPVELRGSGIDYLVSSANKCVEGVPGFSFVIAQRDALLATEGWARTTALDLLAQWKGFEADGQFRFTPPTHALLAFHQALIELDDEGGVSARAARYKANYDTLVAGMRELGFAEYLRPEYQSHIITAFRYPQSPAFDFPRFYESLSAAGFVIYPGKVSSADCFRIGTIGRLFPRNFTGLLGAMRNALSDLDSN